MAHLPGFNGQDPDLIHHLACAFDLPVAKLTDGPNHLQQIQYVEDDEQIHTRTANVPFPTLSQSSRVAPALETWYFTAQSLSSSITSLTPLRDHDGLLERIPTIESPSHEFGQDTPTATLNRPLISYELQSLAQEATASTTSLDLRSWPDESARQSFIVHSHGNERGSIDETEALQFQNEVFMEAPIPESNPANAELAILGPCSRDWTKSMPRRGPKRQLVGPESYSNRAPQRRKLSKQSYRYQTRVYAYPYMGPDTRLTVTPCTRCRVQKAKESPSSIKQTGNTHVRQCLPNPFDPTGTCLPCLKLTRHIPSLRIPCQQHTIEKASLFRDQSRPWQGFGKRVKDMTPKNRIQHWASPRIKIVEITHGYGDVTYRLKLREFITKRGDVIRKTWMDGAVRKSHTIPAYAIADMTAAAVEIRHYISRALFPFVREMVGNRKSDALFVETYRHALQWCKDAPTDSGRSILAATLRLWVVARMTSNREHICAGEAIGSLVGDQSSPYRNTRPVPPMACAQLEVISYTAFLHPLRRQILQMLEHMFMSNTRACWYTVYLTLFIILHSCSLITRRDEEFGREIDHALRFTNSDSIVDHHVGVLTLLTYFHHTCKAKLLMATFGDFRDEQVLATMSEIPHEEILFLQWSGSVIKDKAQHIRAIQQDLNYGDDYYFVSQLVNENWTSIPIASVGEPISSRAQGP